MAFDSNIKGYMTFGKSFSRGGAFPLEAYEIWTDYDALVAYAANTNPDKDPSYIGQKVTYVDKTNNKVTHYGIEIDGTLKELGASLIGDEKSIVIGDNNTISLKGIAGLVFERDILGEDGEPTGQKENVQFQPLMTKDGLIWVEPSKTTVEGLASLIDGLTARVSALENDRVTEEELAAAVKVVADKVGVPAGGDTSTATLYERIAAEVLRATQAEGALSDRIGVAKDGETAATGVYAYVDGVVNALVNGVDPDKIDSLNELIAWVEAHPDIVSELDERLDAAEAILEGFGGEEEPATVKGYIDAEFDAHELAADGKYTTKEELAAHEEAAEAAYATKAELEAHAEAAEAVYATKDELKATDDVAKDAQNRVDIVEGKIDEITSVGGEPNVIEKIKVNGVTLEVEKDAEGKSTKTVSIAVPTSITTMDGYSNLDTRVTTNANGIAALEGQLANTNTNVSNNTTEIGKINTEITTDLKPRIEALEGADEVIEGVVAGHTTAIQTLNETTIPALQGAIEAEAKARDDADKAILTKIGDVATGKTVVDLINEVAGTIDFTPYATNARVDIIYKAADGETPASGVLADEIARATAAEAANVKAITDLTNGAVKKNTDDIAAINALLNTVDSEDAITSLKELALWVEDHETEVLPVIEDQGERLAAAEAILAGIGGEGEKATVKSYVDDAIAAIPAYELPIATVAALGGVKSAADIEGQAAVNKVYVDATTGVGEVKAFSTDNLVQGTMTLVLNGGKA